MFLALSDSNKGNEVHRHVRAHEQLCTESMEHVSLYNENTLPSKVFESVQTFLTSITSSFSQECPENAGSEE